MIPFDLHTHCTLSFDGKSSAEDMVKRAVELGIEYYALTDHVDLGDFADPDFDLEKTVTGAREQIPALRRKYADRINILYGVELGQATQDIDTAERLLAENKYDFVIGSLHNIRRYEDFYFIDFDRIDLQPILWKYFAELAELAEWGKFDSLAHLTYPLRYIIGEHGVNINMNDYELAINKVLKTLVDKDIALEINTSGLRQKIGVTMPDIEIVKKYRRLGGKLITIGSDAHSVKELGMGIDTGIRIAKEAGFNEIAVYIRREPRMIAI
ncbi:MAG: histidinol-phosphatase HisJ family protein [Ruminiclostridium sp.]|nr:histidinol-phosphatase HisJ family protein [Ruminiclostridium sp.]